MKKLFLFSMLLVVFTAKSQSYLGYFNDNYAGVQGVLYNPSSIVDSRFKTDINLFSISGAATNDYYGVNMSDLLKNGYSFEKKAIKFPSGNNNLIANIDVMGPSFMFNLSPKSSLALFTRARVFANFNNLTGQFVAQIDNGFENPTFGVNEGDYNIVTNAWSEYGLSFAHILYRKNQHFLKGGLSLKYLQGMGNAYSYGQNVSLTKTGAIFTSTGQVTYGGSQDVEEDFNNFKIDSKSHGWGVDLGFTYEWRPEYEKYTIRDQKGKSYDLKDKNKYKLRFGLSVTDIGSIQYHKFNENKYNTNGTFTQANYDASTTIFNFLNTTYTKIAPASAPAKVSLPTALHANVDWHLHNKFYLNVNTDFSLIQKTAANKNAIANTVMLAPRFETKWFSIYTPVSWMEYQGVQLGTGFRFGPIFVGSGSIISNLISDNSKAIDAHVGLKIPIYQGKLKDRDQDGLFDKVDSCPTVAGPTENFGCPWPDTDKDGVLDKDDSCLDTIGPIENKGCPWPDTDKDGLLDKDDSCPEVAGPIENKGCPWPDTDKDGVLDKDDKCPDVFGVIENNGCPEIKAVEVMAPVTLTLEVQKEVAKQIGSYSKTILFDTGKATVKSESFGSLDAIVTILNEYPTANFKIEGHTDDTGSAVKNLQLSKDRAAAIKDYFISKGVIQTRLTSEGYGSKKPIASNKTLKGKTLNRRVEINLVK